ncbi:MAG: alpha/beta hydrolase [Victivallales bacterium]|nr:alpha/beta hydrolase [Victivallales bacterium]
MLKTFILIILLLLVFYIVLLLISYFIQEKLIFYPVRDLAATPEELSLNYENVDFASGDGTRLNGWFIPAAKAEYTVLFCHGNGGNISHRLDTISLFNSLAVNFFIFDYRAYGASGGTLSEAGLYADGIAAWRYLTVERGIAPDRIIVVGRSLGGAIAARIAGKFSPAALVLESTFTSIPDMAGKVMPWILFSRRLLRYKLATRTALAEVKCPVLIFASRDDALVPFSMGEKLLAAAKEPKTLVELTGGHDDCYFLCRTKYTEALKNLLKNSAE